MLYGVMSLLLFAFTFYCLLDVVLTDEHEVRNLPKLAWVLLVVLLWGIGGMVWLLAGRPTRQGAAPGGGGATAPFGTPGPRRQPGNHPVGRDRPASPPPSRAPRGPDDDPDFLRRLDERLRDERDG
ncbi:MAG TPA: PLDc N-terminal domain-containing protein [Egicoccus sp.]|nr:PLDc N-terminal domain-containing protein [Egicoccus sp.]HSK24189.1 PLDc N-terminal domain-containing protein [Egicoccus sp.]